MNQQIEQKKREQLAQNIKATRIQRKLTQEDLADVLKISRRNYQRIEAGTQWPTLKITYLLAVAFDTSIDKLLKAPGHE